MNRRQMVTSLLALTGVGAFGLPLMGRTVQGLKIANLAPPTPMADAVTKGQVGGRVYYIDIGDLPEQRAIQYVQEIMASHRRA